MKKGLVLEGGAMRGLFSCGVTDVFAREGIEFDGMVGVSAGAAFGCNVKSRQPGRALRYNMNYCRDPRYCSIRSLLKTGDMFGADFCYHELPEKLDIYDVAAFEANPLEFWIVATDIETGQAVYHRSDVVNEEELEWMRASASMPLVSRIVEINGQKLLDGGIADSIPLKFMQEQGYEKNIVVLTQPRSYTKGENKMLPLIKRSLKKYPKLVEACAKRHEIYNQTLEYIRTQEQLGNVLVIAPKEILPVGRIEHDPQKLKKVHELGEKAALEMLDTIKDFLK